MTPVGHSLVGVSLGLACLPDFRTRRAKAAFLAGFSVLANVPDLPLPCWGHTRYDISHSLFVSLSLIALASVGLRLWPRIRPTLGSSALLAAGAAAWLSHLLLDSFYSHGLGIAIFWPFSQARLVLPVPWFDVLDGGITTLSLDNLRICLVELAFYSPLPLITVWVRRHLQGRFGQPIL